MTTLLPNYKLLVGSRAIQYYVNLNRPVKDWDIWAEKVPTNNEIIKGELVDYHQVTASEVALINALNLDNLPNITTPVGPALVTPLWFNFLLKASHYSLNKKAKHLQDYQLLNNLSFPKPKEFDQLLLNRFQETQARQEDFFDKSVPRFLPHDWVHLQVALGMGRDLPAFITLLAENNYQTDEAKFNELPYEVQKTCALEEAIVLGLERWLIYNIALRPGSVIQRWEVFCSKHSPALEWLDRLGSIGRVQQNPEYISKFIQNNYQVLLTELPEALCHLKNNMPQSWWTGVLGIRCEKK
jgi:hypothetical protein